MDVRLARPADLPSLVDAYVDATVDEAVSVWVEPDEEKRRAFIATELPDLVDRGELLVAVSDRVLGVAVRSRETGAERVRAAAAALPDGDAATVVRATAAVHPDVAHLYLAAMAVRPDDRGRGVGSALLTAVLAEADRDRLPVYLEASTADNARLYARHGFHPTGPSITLPGLTVQPMTRSAVRG